MKVLLLLDGRDFQVVACPYTEEDKEKFEDEGLFDTVEELELVGDLPTGKEIFSIFEGPGKVRFLQPVDYNLGQLDGLHQCGQGTVAENVILTRAEMPMDLDE